ncbi:SDR family NAD(P)-dependent oxidoreductase [Dactylosporangium sucinum]|uniref:Short-chain dehydrogenase n=1 Tax=Dactylosporangium sucinum TaxID=1424081 RepID=A0A917X8I6_9ACTN|nr:SDR family oxidoreductase [Dactylosporangium sucinum]GGM89452.1 short-chain dehydrogenase [Dactylosporangium sucinum]
MTMESFAGKLAVVTGGGSGMGRELVLRLAAEGCSVACCDLDDRAAETAAAAVAAAPPGTRVTAHACDVSDEAQVLRFRDEVARAHPGVPLNLVFNNAGIGGAGSFVEDSREMWERVFAIDWWGVYYCTRAFLPLLMAADEGVLVNTSSMNAFYPSHGVGRPLTAYGSAKAAVKAFSEALIDDLAEHAPHVRVAVVMPGHIGTDFFANSRRAHGEPDPATMSAAELDDMRPILKKYGVADDATTEELRAFMLRPNELFREMAPVTAAQAAGIILDAVRAGRWRILVGADAADLDARVRADPDGMFYAKAEPVTASTAA